MREIKFRARCHPDDKLNHGQTVYGMLVIYPDNKLFPYWIYPCNGEQNYPVDPKTVAQLVGRDKNGVEIYEGDRLFRNDGEIFIAKVVSYVECEDDEELKGVYVEPERFRIEERVA